MAGSNPTPKPTAERRIRANNYRTGPATDGRIGKIGFDPLTANGALTEYG